MKDNREKHYKNSDSAGVRLLESAEQLFAAKGFSATSVRDITDAANCNLASVNYHFGSKENLYRKVFLGKLAIIKEMRIKSIQEAMDESCCELSLENLVRTFARSFIESLRCDGGEAVFLNLVIREMLDPQLPREIFYSDFIEPVTYALREAFCRLCPGMDRVVAQRCIYSLVGQLNHMLRMMNYFGQSITDEDFAVETESIIDHVVNFTVGGIRACVEVNNEKL